MQIISGVITALERTKSVMKLTSLSRDALSTILSSYNLSCEHSGDFWINLKISAFFNKAAHSDLIRKKLLRVKIWLKASRSFM